MWLIVALWIGVVAVSWLGLAAAQDEPSKEPDTAVKEFVPSEALPADSAISFPADI